MGSPRLSIVVLAWDQLPLTKACVESLRSTTDVTNEVIIVDNGSEKEAAEWARQNADRAVLNNTNLGFAPGMNRGLEAASGEFVAFVNNDTVFPTGWASSLLDTFEEYPTSGIVLPAVTAAGNPTSVRAATSDVVTMIPPFQALPSGVVYMLHTDFARSIGGWDERYLVASREDLDLLFTTWTLGRDVILDERVLVEHVSNATATAQLPDRDEIWMRNWSVFVEKWVGDDPTSGHPDTDPGRVVAAAAAASWLDRWYTEFNRVAELERELRSRDKRIAALQSQTADLQEQVQNQSSTGVTGLLKRIRRAVGRRLPRSGGRR